MRITLDFETRSTISIADVDNAYKYSVHPTTEVMCLGWDCDGVEDQWKYEDLEPPHMLFYQLKAADDVQCAGHNVEFEMEIWKNVCVKRYGWPEVPFDRWRCTAAKAAAYSLPRALDKIAVALDLPTKKDKVGKDAMRKLAKPRKPTKKNKELWVNDAATWDAMYSYNMDDVRAEKQLDDYVPDLSPRDLELLRATWRMNQRGVGVDVVGVRQAVKVATEWEQGMLKRFHAITGVDAPTKREKFKAWVNEHGVALDNTQADTLDELLKRTPPGDVAEAVGIVRSIGRSSVAKYQKMLDMEVLGRIYGLFLWHGANTGRWTARGVQPHNFPRGAEKKVDQAWEIIRQGDLGAILLFADDPMKFLSGALRSALWAEEGNELDCGDFSAIEARITFWLAGQEDALEVFRRNIDIYIEMAETIYNRKGITKKNAEERFLGKQAILGLGFGMGFVKFLLHCRHLGVKVFPLQQILGIVPGPMYEALYKWIWEDSWHWIKERCPELTKDDVPQLVLMKHVTDTYRRKYKKVVQAWYDTEEAFKAALRNPGKRYSVARCVWYYDGAAMKCELPSGRELVYPSPRVDEGGSLQYMGVDERSNWSRQHTWGGTLFQNTVQGTAADVMGEALLRAENTPPYDRPVLTVHDELVVEHKVGLGSLEDFLRLVVEPPKWADGLPIEAEGWRGRRYRK